MNVNKVILVGRLTRDPEMRSTPSGANVARIGLATSSNWTDKSGQRQEKTEFHNLVVWNRLAEIASQYLIKGQECYFEGRLQANVYTGKDGVERRNTEIVVENMQMGQKPRGASDYQGRNQAQTPSSSPAAGAASTGSAQATAGAGAVASQPASAKATADKEDEIPTINLDDDKDEEVKIEDVPF